MLYSFCCLLFYILYFAFCGVPNSTLSLGKGEMLSKFCCLFFYVLYNKNYTTVKKEKETFLKLQGLLLFIYY